MPRVFYRCAALVLCLIIAPPAHPQSDLAGGYKRQVVDDVEAMKKRTQVMNDMVFSFAELGFRSSRPPSISPKFSRRKASRSSAASRACRRPGWRHGDRVGR